jgi:hypothetical protein
MDGALLACFGMSTVVQQRLLLLLLLLCFHWHVECID